MLTRLVVGAYTLIIFISYFGAGILSSFLFLAILTMYLDLSTDSLLMSFSMLNCITHILSKNGAVGINEALTATTDFKLADKVIVNSLDFRKKESLKIAKKM